LKKQFVKATNNSRSLRDDNKKATATADPCGMTIRKATATADPCGMTTRKATATADPCGMRNKKGDCNSRSLRDDKQERRLQQQIPTG
jgi:hypothetical protein